MNQKRILTVAVVVAGLVLVTAYASPYWTLHQMRSAIDHHDADGFSDHVDFPSLRESVKGQIMAKIGTGTDKEDAKADPFDSVGHAMAIALLNPMVEAAISPAGVIAMIESGRAGPSKQGSTVDASARSRDKIDYSVSYRSWDKVAVTTKDSDGGSFVFKRHGIWDWKLSSIELPEDASAGKR